MIDRLKTTRLLLRPVSDADLGLLANLTADPEVMRYITGRPSSVDEVGSELARALGNRWLVFDREVGEFLGWVGAIPSAEGGEYEHRLAVPPPGLGPRVRDRGSSRARRWLFADGASRVFAQTMAVNKRSRAVMERLGLRPVRIFRVEFDDPLPGTELGEVEYELRREEWTRRASKP